MSDDKKVIFSMSGVTKAYQNSQTPVLKNIYLSFFYGAKIGILGLNGSGKSTLLKIISGVETNYRGDVVFADDTHVTVFVDIIKSFNRLAALAGIGQTSSQATGQTAMQGATSICLHGRAWALGSSPA